MQKIKKHFFMILVAALLLPYFSFAQQPETEKDTVDLGILYKKQFSGNIMLHTLGYGVGIRKGWNKNYFKKYFFEADLLEMRSPNQTKSYNLNFSNLRGYYYGKLNALDIIRVGAGTSTLINRKPYWGGIDVRHFLSGGLSLGLQIPVYLNIVYYYEDNNTQYFNVVVEKYDPEKHYPYLGMNPDCDCEIYSKGPILKGLTEVKPIPGLYLKTGFNFDFSKENDRVRALEVGVTAEGFIKAVQMMAFDDPRRFFITGYFNYHFGKNYD